MRKNNKQDVSAISGGSRMPHRCANCCRLPKVLHSSSEDELYSMILMGPPTRLPVHNIKCEQIKAIRDLADLGSVSRLKVTLFLSPHKTHSIAPSKAICLLNSCPESIRQSCHKASNDVMLKCQASYDKAQSHICCDRLQWRNELVRGCFFSRLA